MKSGNLLLLSSHPPAWLLSSAPALQRRSPKGHAGAAGCALQPRAASPGKDVAGESRHTSLPCAVTHQDCKLTWGQEAGMAGVWETEVLLAAASWGR